MMAATRSAPLSVHLWANEQAAWECLEATYGGGISTGSPFVAGLREKLLDRACSRLKLLGYERPITNSLRSGLHAALKGLLHLGIQYRWNPTHRKLEWRRRGELDWRTYED